MKKLTKDEKGFTIIEVLIVLAIAGLIMLIVFLAVPALQRNQRNNARNAEASRVVSAITECLNNRNGVKTSCDQSAEIQAGTLNELSLPAGTFTATDASGTTAGTGSTTAVSWAFQRTCDAAGAADQAGTVRQFVVVFQLEPTVNRCLPG